MMTMRGSGTTHLIRCAVVLMALVAAAPTRGDTRISGDARTLTLETHDATVHEALHALNTGFEVRVRTSTPLDRPVEGTYTGSLRRVVMRLLEGYNFVTLRRGNRVELFVYGRVTAARVATRDAPPQPQQQAAAPAPAEAAVGPAQVAVGIATATGPNRRTRPRR